MSRWREILEDAQSRIADPARREKLAALMERSVELAFQKAAGMAVDEDLDVVAATAASLASAEVATVQQAITEAVWAEIRAIVFGLIFRVPAP